MFDKNRIMYLLLGTAAMVVTQPAYAQQGAETTSAASSVDDGEIIVTAQRRSESLQEVPIAINQFSGSTLEKLSIVQPSDLQRIAPGFNFQTESGSAQLTIRGVGTGYSGQGLEQSVGLYIDGSYVSSQIGAAPPLLDIKQVQVLKGPQGALYGRNATGGAVLIDTNDPSLDGVSGYVKAGYGNYSWVRTEGVINLPVSETVGVRLAGQFQDRKSFTFNERAGRHDYGMRDFSVRGKILLQPSEALRVVGSTEYYRGRQEAPHINVAQGSICSYCGTLGIGLPSGFYRTYANTGEELEALLGPRAGLTGSVKKGEVFSRVLNSNLRVEYDFGGVMLRSVTGYRNAKSDGPNNDQDAGPLPLIFTFSQIDNKSFNQDLQLSSDSDGAFNFTAGVNYQRDSNQYQLGLAGSLFGPLAVVTDSRNRTNSYSVFGEGYFKFLDGFTLTLGARYTRDKRRHAFTNNADAAIVFGTVSAVQRASYNAFTPRVVLAYDAGDANYYVSFNKGVKAGGFNSPSYGVAPPVDPEKITAYEVGAKFQLLDRRLRLNFAAFHYEWKDLQVAVIDSANGGLAQQNAAAALADGAEVSVDWSFGNGLTLSAAGLYLNSRYQSFPNASVFVPAGSITPGATGQVTASEDLRGFQTPNAPKLSATGTLDYRFDLGMSGWTANATGSVSYKSKHDMQPGAGGIARLIRQDGYATATLRFAVSNPGNDLTVSVWADNVTRTKYYLNLVATVDGGYGIPAAPRTFGVTATKRF